MPVDYRNGKIYKLVNSVDGDIYVGSTATTYLSHRFGQHKQEALRKPDRKVYQHCAEVGWNNVWIELIENFACADRNELDAREAHWVSELHPALNDRVPGKNMRADPKAYFAQHYQENIEENRRKSREQYQKHASEKRAKACEKLQCECGSQYSRSAKARHLASKKHKTWEAEKAAPSFTDAEMDAYIESLLE